MSAILHRRDIHVAISAQDAGLEFAESSGDVQAQFLSGLLDAVDDWGRTTKAGCWAMQCRYIADEIHGDRRSRLAALLGTLVEHLNEPEGGV
jgi:hypothetical protein